jgi:phage-related protein
VFYIAKLSEGIYVLHAFEKRTRKTPKADIELARGRLGALLQKRRADQATRR